MNKLSTLFLTTSVLLSGPTFGFSAWDKKNNPENFEWDYETAYSKLPKTGKLTEMPWSGDYWPTYKGGITYRWNDKESEDKERFSYEILKDFKDIKKEDIKKLSPAEKYDLFLGRTEFPLTNYERKRTNIMKTIEGHESYEKDFKIPTWEGLCHAWAPATVLYSNPEPVTMIGKKGHKIEFGSSDIKALLTYHLHLAKAPRTRFLGSRCNMEFGKIYKDLENNPTYENKVSVLIEKIKGYKKTLTDELSLNDDSDLNFSWEKKKVIMETFNKLTNDEEDVKKLNNILKNEVLNLENKTFIKEMIEKKLTMASELEGKMNRDECRDTNAGAFHVVITNQIANMDESFIVDVTRDSEVWNQAVQGFDVKEIETKEPSEGSAEGTVKEVVVETKMHYVVEIHHAWDKVSPANQITTKTYRYKLELDKDDKIIGGEWITLDRPDFIWKNDLSEFKGIFEDLGRIYKKSTSYKKKMTSSSTLEERNKIEKEKKELEERIKKFEEEKEKTIKENEEEAKRLEAELKRIEEKKSILEQEKEELTKVFEKEKKELTQKLEDEIRSLERRLNGSKEELSKEILNLKAENERIKKNALKEKESLENKIKEKEDSLKEELAKLDSKKKSLIEESTKLKNDKEAFNSYKKDQEKTLSNREKNLKKDQKRISQMKKDFEKKQKKELAEILKKKEDLKKQMKKFSLKRAQFEKERAIFKKELANFEKEKNIGITKDLIKDLKTKIQDKDKIVIKLQDDFNRAKKITDAAYKNYKKLRGSIFNRNYKKLKKIYKEALTDQKLKSKDLKFAQKELERLRTQLRDATNRLRIASSN